MEKQYIGYVYKVTLSTGKSYIGSLKQSYFDPAYWGSTKNENYWHDLYLQGKENAQREILSWHTSIEEMKIEESRQIELQNTLEPNGYNLSSHTGIKGIGHKIKGRKYGQRRWDEQRKEQHKQKMKEYWTDERKEEARQKQLNSPKHEQMKKKNSEIFKERYKDPAYREMTRQAVLNSPKYQEYLKKKKLTKGVNNVLSIN